MFAKRTVGVNCVFVTQYSPYDGKYGQLLHEKVLLDAITELKNNLPLKTENRLKFSSGF